MTFDTLLAAAQEQNGIFGIETKFLYQRAGATKHFLSQVSL